MLFLNPLGRVRAACVAVGVAGVLSGGLASSAVADPTSFNNATLKIHGGDAVALSGCLNLAKVKAKYPQVQQTNFCKNLARAFGGSVELNNVTATITQLSSSTTANQATLDISGGDATAIAACVNVLQGTASVDQTNTCKNHSLAVGGNVTLNNVDIEIFQASV